MGKLLITCGYMGSGSSAMTDILSEIDGFNGKNGDFEYVFLHCPDGLFDLEDKLLLGNNSLRSDEAIHRFVECMKTLYDKKHYWVGDYKNKLTPSFMEYTYNFVNDLDTYTIYDDWAHWYFSENPNYKMLLQRQIWKLFEAIPPLKGKFSYPKLYKETYLSFPSKNLFYSSAKKFIYSVFEEMGLDNENIIVDQLLLPHNLHRFDNYFNKDTIVFVIDRDPRDVYLGNKYFWIKNNQHVVFPMEIDSFCDFYQRMRENEIPYNSKNIVRIHFEDLIYRYDDTLSKIYDVLGITSDKHVKKGTQFNPSKSINNTQLFKINELFEKEGEFIKERLGDYIYVFPDDAPYDINHMGVF